MYTTQQLVTLARSIADLAGSKAITPDDEVSFLNEAYKSMYSKYTASGGEFWVEETLAQCDDTNLSPFGKGREYLIDLPLDFYQLRGVDWSVGSSWSPVQKVSWSQRDYLSNNPGYRLKKSKLMIISDFRPELRVSYYPVPETLAIGATNLDYPTADMYEILAYEMATSFLRKQTDMVKLPPVQAKLDLLWARFDQILKQDQYQFERIQNDYTHSTPWQ
jgi:hypothetical protein